MKKSICSGAFHQEYDFEGMFRKAKELGFDCIELGLADGDRTDRYFNFNSGEADYAFIRNLIAQYGVDVRSVATGLYWSNGAFGSNDPAKSAEAVKILRKQIEIAKGIGADTILVVTCIDEETGYMESVENTINVFRSLETEITEAGINIGLENVWNRFFMSPIDVKYVLDKIDNPFVGLYFDIGNMVAFAQPEYWIEPLGKYIKKVHIKDFKRTKGYNSGGVFCDLLEGDVDFEKCIPLLKKVGYNGPLSAELFYTDTEITLSEFLEKTYKAVEKITDMAQ